ncbi:MAG: DNA recombination/repair protein RecA, partial [Elusimicrobiota bacterium]
RLDIRRIENLKQGDQIYGARCRVKVVKNKVAPPYRQAVFDMIHGHGVSREGCLLDMGVESGLVEKSGSWLLYKGERLGQGRDNAKANLLADAKTAGELEKALREKFLVGGVLAQAGAVPQEEDGEGSKTAPKAAKKTPVHG